MPTYLLDPSVCFLNHGSFGSTPKELLDSQQSLRMAMEREPVDFLLREYPGRWEASIDAISEFLGSDREGTVFVHNATSGVNAVISSLDLGPSDQILTTNHRYDAVRNTFEYAANRRGIEVVEAHVPFPIEDSGVIVEAVTRAITPRTKLLVIDQISSPTALIFPVAALIAVARSHGIPVLVDGAHAPGQVDVNLREMAPDFWVGNLHKWMCAPKGAAVLYVGESWRDQIHPTTISHGYGKGLHQEFSWTGTLDPTAWFSAVEAIALHKAQGGAQFRAAHHKLVQTGRAVIARALGVELPHPDDPGMYGSMATIPLPCTAEDIPALFDAVRHEDGIEVPILVWDQRPWVRISGFAGYNRPQQYEQLAAALRRRLISNE
jgi:isopenicillin-N epimerase